MGLFKGPEDEQVEEGACQPEFWSGRGCSAQPQGPCRPQGGHTQALLAD